MRERLEKLLSGSVKDMTLGTFHAIAPVYSGVTVRSSA